MRAIGITMRAIPILFLGLFLHYVLPQHDIVRVISVTEIRQDFKPFNRIFYAQADSGSAEMPNRDVRLISTDKQKTMFLGFMSRDASKVMVYRNEDTGWIWPPYFKFDSSDLQAEAEKLGKVESWAVITHYGWRVRWASIYPNAIAIRPVDGRDVRIVPWFNIFFFGFLIMAIVMIRKMWFQFRERALDPALDSAGDRLDEVQAGVAEKRSGISRWLGTWKRKDRK